MFSSCFIVWLLLFFSFLKCRICFIYFFCFEHTFHQSFILSFFWMMFNLFLFYFIIFFIFCIYSFLLFILFFVLFIFDIFLFPRFPYYYVITLNHVCEPMWTKCFCLFAHVSPAERHVTLGPEVSSSEWRRTNVITEEFCGKNSETRTEAERPRPPGEH